MQCISFHSDRLTVGECLQHPWIKEAADRGKGQLDLGHLRSFQARDTAQVFT
jgi:hypothetical protein